MQSVRRNLSPLKNAPTPASTLDMVHQDERAGGPWRSPEPGGNVAAIGKRADKSLAVGRFDLENAAAGTVVQIGQCFADGVEAAAIGDLQAGGSKQLLGKAAVILQPVTERASTDDVIAGLRADPEARRSRLLRTG